MRFADRVESGWATMTIVALFAVTLLCLAIADGIRAQREHQPVEARNKALIEELIRRIHEVDGNRVMHHRVRSSVADEMLIQRLDRREREIQRLDDDIARHAVCECARAARVKVRIPDACLANPLAAGCM